MKRKNFAVKCVSIVLGGALCAGTLSAFAGCGEKQKWFTVMTDALNGLYSPFFASAGTDMNVAGQTQIGMLNTDENGKIAYGDNQPVVVKDYDKKYDNVADKTTYTFVLKNGIEFSDGKPLTMNDVMFNIYVYLDPTYTGSSTMYSTDIVGLANYRMQRQGANINSEDSELTNGANTHAKNRRDELITLYKSDKNNTSPTADEMRSRIEKHTPSSGYMNAIGVKDATSARKQLKEDYEDVLKSYREDLELDYESAADAFTEAPYDKHADKFADKIFCFMFYENHVDIEYENIPGQGINKNNIINLTGTYPSSIKTKEAAINYVFDFDIASNFEAIMRYTSTGTKMMNNYVAKAKDVILSDRKQDDGSLTVPSVSGIKSLGHLKDDETKVTSVTVNGNNYTVAQNHNDDGTPTNSNEYDVLQVTINGVDPKAVWNFAFSVAPYHYYSDPTQEDLKVDIKNDKFGVRWGEYSNFMVGVLQAGNKNKIPVGAGPYIATNEKVGDGLPVPNDFYKDGYVYYRSNPKYIMGEPKIHLFRYKYVSSSNALNALKRGDVDFAEPQLTATVNKEIDSSKDIQAISTWQLGYGYVGVNASKIKDINLRKAIMAAMDPKLAISYYELGAATNISYPMSIVSWAYPRTGSYNAENLNGNLKDNIAHDYTMFVSEENAKEKIKTYMNKAGVQPGDSALKLKLTIAGSNMTEHPLYKTFLMAMKLLNECGWEVSVVPDTNALIKLASGDLAVWAAAWGATIDPDMYQVYHKNSTATSVLSWGYRAIFESESSYKTEVKIINELSKLIEQARESDEESVRAPLYEQAMDKVLELAVELPIYQRKALYAYNSKVINAATLPKNVNSFNSPLSEIWKVELVG